VATTISAALVALILMMAAAGGMMISITQIRPVEAPNLSLCIPILQKVTIAVDCLHSVLRHENDRVKQSEILDYLNDPDNEEQIQHWISSANGKEILIVSMGVRKGTTIYWAGYIYPMGRPNNPITIFARPINHWTHILRRDAYQANPFSPGAVSIAKEYGFPIYAIGLK